MSNQSREMPDQSPGEQAIREGLRQSVEKNRMQVELAQETIAIIQNQIRQSVKDAIDEALSEGNAEKFWLIGLNTLRRQTAEKTGTLMGGVIMAVFRKGLVFLILGGIVYAAGGWTALAVLWKGLLKLDAV